MICVALEYVCLQQSLARTIAQGMVSANILIQTKTQ